MAPEQLEGKEADERTDIFAFGTLLYEMATGRSAFEGDEPGEPDRIHPDRRIRRASSTRAATPAADGLPDALDHVVERVLRRTLTSVGRPRATSKRDRLDRRWKVAATTTAADTSERLRRRGSHRVAGATALLRSQSIGCCAPVISLLAGPDTPRSATFSPPPGGTRRWRTSRDPCRDFTRRPAARVDRNEVKARTRLWGQRLDSTDAAAAPGNRRRRSSVLVARQPLHRILCSRHPPDDQYPRGGRHNYRSGDASARRNVESGRGHRLFGQRGGTAVSDLRRGRLGFPLLGIARIARAYGPPFCPMAGISSTSRGLKDQDLSRLARFEGHAAPGSGVRWCCPCAGSSPVAASRRPRGGISSRPRLIARPFDADRLQLTGDAFPLAEQIRVSNALGARRFFRFERWQADRPERHLEHRAGLVRSEGQRHRDCWSSRHSSSTTRALARRRHCRDGGVGSRAVHDINLFDLARRSESRLTSDPALDAIPRWSPDGTQIVFASARDNLPPNLFRKAATESVVKRGFSIKSDSEPNRLVSGWVHRLCDARSENPMGSVAASNGSGCHRRGTHARAASADAVQRVTTVRVSPDGRWITYDSDESGEWGIYVQEFAAPVSRRPKADFGERRGPAHLAKRRESSLYLAVDTTLMEVPIKPGPVWRARPPQPPVQDADSRSGYSGFERIPCHGMGNVSI